VVNIRNLANLMLAPSFINMVALVVLQDPVLLLIQRFGGHSSGLVPLVSAVTGLAPLGALAAWVMFRETNETVPHVVSTSVFASLVLSPAERRRAGNPEPAL